MRRLFISDLHLDTPTSAQFLRFAECLDLESSRVEEIYILGDLVEMWIGDDDSSAFTTALVDVLRRTSEQCAVFLMHGNRDFLFGEQFAQHTGGRSCQTFINRNLAWCCVMATNYVLMMRSISNYACNYAARHGNRTSWRDRWPNAAPLVMTCANAACKRTRTKQSPSWMQTHRLSRS